MWLLMRNNKINQVCLVLLCCALNLKLLHVLKWMCYNIVVVGKPEGVIYAIRRRVDSYGQVHASINPDTVLYVTSIRMHVINTL